MNYYFFAASLPVLALDAPTPFPFDVFKALCAEHLRGRDLKGLEELEEGVRAPRHPFVRAWHDIEGQLRNALAEERASRLQKDAQPYLRPREGFDPAVGRAAAEAFGKTNPLQREQMLDRFRWRQLEALAGFNPFSGSALLAYGVRLKLAERWNRMSEEQGSAKADALVARTPVPAATD